MPALPEPHRELRGHDFWPSTEVLQAIPPLYGTERTPERDKVVHLHYFSGRCDWWVLELDQAGRLAFGFACLGDPAMAEWGYINLHELAEMLGPGTLTEVEEVASLSTPSRSSRRSSLSGNWVGRRGRRGR